MVWDLFKHKTELKELSCQCLLSVVCRFSSRPKYASTTEPSDSLLQLISGPTTEVWAAFSHQGFREQPEWTQRNQRVAQMKSMDQSKQNHLCIYPRSRWHYNLILEDDWHMVTFKRSSCRHLLTFTTVLSCFASSSAWKGSTCLVWTINNVLQKKKSKNRATCKLRLLLNSLN